MRAAQVESTFIRHVPCGKCGSQDNNALYSDGHTYCFGCSTHSGTAPGSGTEADPAPSRPRKDRMKMQLLEPGEVRALRARKIDERTCKHFGYTIGEDRDGTAVQIAPYFDADGKLVAQKVRYAGKDFKFAGDAKEALPFGSHCWAKTGKMLVVTEGEIDALSMSQVQNNKYPVVSIGCGADTPVDREGNPINNAGTKIRKYFAKHLSYFSGFEKVVLMFDSDEAGRFSAKVAASVLGRRAHIATLPLKDSNEMLVQGRVEDLLNCMWKAEPFRPEGLVDMASLADAVKKEPEQGLSWCFPRLTEITYGKRLGEIYAIGAGTGVGKTDLVSQDITHMVLTHKVPVGVFSLEQGVVETAKRIAGKVGGKTFHVPDGSWTQRELDAAWTTLDQGGKVWLYDSFGANEWSTIAEKIEYLAHAEDVRWFYLDHLTALAAAEEDERVALERIMAEMGALVKKLNITIHFISHLATPEGKPHEEGGRVTIRHFKGSRAIGFWSHYMFGMERNQQAEDITERHTTTFRVLKDRYTGRATGEVIYLGYEQDTGRLYQTVAPDRQKGKASFKEEKAPTSAARDDF